MQLKDFEAAKDMVGGSFRLTVLLQKRIIEIVRGAAPLVTLKGNPSPIEIALQEVLQDKIHLEAIPKEEFDKLVEEARLEKEAKAVKKDEFEPPAFGPRPSMPTIELPGEGSAGAQK